MGRSLGVTLFGVYLLVTGAAGVLHFFDDTVSRKTLKRVEEIERHTRAKLRNGAWPGQQATQIEAELLPLIDRAKAYLGSPRAAALTAVFAVMSALQMLAGLGLILRWGWSRGFTIGLAVAMLLAHCFTAELTGALLVEGWEPGGPSPSIVWRGAFLLAVVWLLFAAWIVNRGSVRGHFEPGQA